MKRKLLFLTGFIVVCGGFLVKNNFSGSSKTLRVAFPVTLKSLSYEPTNIHLSYEYIFLENIYSPLVEIDAKGDIQPGVAEKADWLGDELHFRIRPNLKTQGGTPITAEDVIFSLKRLLILSGNTHGNFRDLVCPGVQIKTVDDPCPGIRLVGNTVILTAGERKSFLLPMLAAIDFAIIPRSSVDSKTLAIVNMKETSGPYYVVSDDGAGNIELALNKSHYFAASDVPQSIKLIPMTKKLPGESLRALLENQIDHLTTIDNSRADEILPFAKAHSDYSVHATMKIRSIVLVFTERGAREFSEEERRYIGKQTRLAFGDIYGTMPGFEKREEFFPNLSDGGLTEEQQEQLSALNQETATKLRHRVKLGLLKRANIESWSRPIKTYLPEADCYQEKDAPDLKKNPRPDEIPHAFIAATDTGFMEDISLISYSLNAGFLGLPKNVRSQWLADYMAIDQKKDRMTKLRRLHYEALSKAVVVPLVASAYTAMVRKPWRMELSELYANNQLWRIKLN